MAWAQSFFGRRCPHVAVDTCAKTVLSCNGNGQLRLFGVGFRESAALLFKKFCPARPYSGGVAYSPRQNSSCQKTRGQFGAEGIHTPCRNRAGRAEHVFPRRKGLTDFEARRPTLPPLTVSRAQDGLTDFELRRPTLKIVSQKPFSAQQPGGRLCQPV